MKKRVYAFIHGDVIGVGFRSWVVNKALSLHLTGWVRNTQDDRVEAVFEGERENLMKMIDKCSDGPEVSWVEKVESQWQEATGEFNSFYILR